MAANRAIEGTGQEIAEYAQQHPLDRFQLIPLDGQLRPAYGPGSEGWERMMELRDRLKDVLPAIPREATSTEALYD